METSLRPLDAVLAERYTYLQEGLINYRVPFPEMWTLAGTFEDEHTVFALLKATGDAAPYPAKFGFLKRAENRALTRHVDLCLVQAWPRPTMTIVSTGTGPARALGEDRPAKTVDVQLKKVGFAQLWWSDDKNFPVGLIWEAVLDIKQPDLLAFLWDKCEMLLEERGTRRCFTTHRDPDYTPDAYRRLLETREYQVVDRADAVQPHSGGKALCAVKIL